MIECKSPRQIIRMREAGRIVAGALSLIEGLAKSGVTTDFLNDEADRYVRAHRGTPVFKGYRRYPKSICTSINEEVVHGIPGPRKLCEGDILSVDIGVEYRKYVADAAVTIPIGEVLPEAQRLIEVCRRALYQAIEAVRPGARLSEVSGAIQQFVEANGYAVIRDYTGHGIGRRMHEDPQVPNYVSEALLANDVILLEGTALAIEPMICQGGPETEVLDNQWTVVTKDRKLSAHFEHTVVVTESGCEILTLG
ncbi:MAG: type I methionyl aminopeptidase [Candidatus Brocadiales bacterium]|nr:type I methionyl aminopeptidase [Candidatus Brocadiales bacterium]